jgi:hypothetical protein
VRDWKEEMPYRISYIDTLMLTDEQIKEGILRTEEFPTEPSALARARELLEDLDGKMVLMSDNFGEHLTAAQSAAAQKNGARLGENRAPACQKRLGGIRHPGGNGPVSQRTVVFSASEATIPGGGPGKVGSETTQIRRPKSAWPRRTFISAEPRSLSTTGRPGLSRGRGAAGEIEPGSIENRCPACGGTDGSIPLPPLVR